MTAKLDLFAAAPSLMKTWFGASAAINSSLDPSLAELVKIRASQINGCANCINMHTAEAREKGETEQRLYLLPAWREAPCYTDRERAALAWTEAVTLIADGHAPDAVYQEVRHHLNERELSDLTLAIAAINAWNRLSIAARLVPGGYRAAAVAS